MKRHVPFTSVSVDPEIQRMRELLTSGDDIVMGSDGTIGRFGDPQFEDIGSGTKAKTVPKAIVSVSERCGSVRDLINEIRNEDGTGSVDDVASESEEAADSSVKDTFKKSGTVPKSILSTRSVRDLINEMRGEEDSETENVDDDIEANADGPQANPNPKLVPKTVVSADQWYEKNPDLLTAEKVAMYDFQGRKAKFCILKDGRACWLVSARPKVACKSKCAKCTMQNCKRRCISSNSNPQGIMCRKYDLMLIYDNDHPQARYGSSVKAYLLNPTVNQLQSIVNRTSGVTPKNIPHLLRDENGELYLCSADTRDVSTSPDSAGGITSAATSLRFALRWLNIFEDGLIDPDIWRRFQKHGEI